MILTTLVDDVVRSIAPGDEDTLCTREPHFAQLDSSSIHTTTRDCFLEFGSRRRTLSWDICYNIIRLFIPGTDKKGDSERPNDAVEMYFVQVRAQL